MGDLYIKNGEVLIDKLFVKANITVKDGKISRIEKEDSFDGTCPVVDASGKRIVPGFIDIHTHGGAGVDVNNATIQDIGRLSRFYASQGTTGWLASVAADTEENTLRCIDQISSAVQSRTDGAQVL
jgi:N-acetylglucosamine-6-phosphate deacetylase